jgi:serine/threonine protein kinase
MNELLRHLLSLLFEKAIFHLQKKGVCHRDICLENLLFDKNDNLVLIDPGMSLRVPYSDPCNYGCVADASAGTSRILMISQGQGGKHMYAAPEVLSEQEAVDAFAIDLWSVGVILFVMLVGLAPFKWAHPTDQRYSKISKGGLKELMKMLDIPLSPEACDLLQGLFYSDPCKRFTLADIMNHPWFQGKRFANTPVSTSKQPKIFTFSLETRKHNSPPRKNKRHEKRKKTKHNQQQLPSRKSLLDLPF